MGVTPEEVTCLADNIYFEARNQGLAGMLAVTNVVMNRVADDRYPDRKITSVIPADIDCWTW